MTVLFVVSLACYEVLRTLLMYFILVITFHCIRTDGSFLKEFTPLESYYFTLRKLRKKGLFKILKAKYFQ